MRAVVVGATGAHGRRVASELVRSDEVNDLVLVATRLDRLGRLAAVLGGPTRNVSTSTHLDGAVEGADVVLSCLDGDHASCVRASIAAGSACVVLADDAETWDRVRVLNDAARTAGTTVVSGCGFSPGITNLMVVVAAGKLDDTEAVTLSVARSLADTDGRASITGLLDLFRGTADFPGDRPEDPGHLPRLVYFPEPIGWVETFRATHPEAFSLRRMALEYRVGLTERAGADIARAAGALRLTDRRLARRIWVRLATSAGPLVRGLSSAVVPWSGARVDAHGIRDGRAETVTLGLVDHLSNLVPLMSVTAALRLGAKEGAEPGVHAPEDLFDARSMLGSLARRGVRLAQLEPEPV